MTEKIYIQTQGRVPQKEFWVVQEDGYFYFTSTGPEEYKEKIKGIMAEKYPGGGWVNTEPDSDGIIKYPAYTPLELRVRLKNSAKCEIIKQIKCIQDALTAANAYVDDQSISDLFIEEIIVDSQEKEGAEILLSPAKPHKQKKVGLHTDLFASTLRGCCFSRNTAGELYPLDTERYKKDKIYIQNLTESFKNYYGENKNYGNLYAEFETLQIGETVPADERFAMLQGEKRPNRTPDLDNSTYMVLWAARDAGIDTKEIKHIETHKNYYYGKGNHHNHIYFS